MKPLTCFLRIHNVSKPNEFSDFDIGGDLFTLTNYDPPPRQNLAGTTNVDFAYDLYLPDDEIVIFPGNMGVTG